MWCDSQKRVWYLTFLTSAPDLDVVWIGHQFFFWLQGMKGGQLGIPNCLQIYYGVGMIWQLKHNPTKRWLQSSTSSFPLLLPREAWPRCGCVQEVLPAAICRIQWFAHCSGYGGSPSCGQRTPNEKLLGADSALCSFWRPWNPFLFLITSVYSYFICSGPSVVSQMGSSTAF